MRRSLRESGVLRGSFAALLLLVLALRLVAPTGYMPVATSEGVRVELCSGSEPRTLTLDLGSKAPAAKHDAADAPCAFSAASGLALASLVTPGLPLPLAAAQRPAGRAIADLTVHRLAAPPPPAHAPPAAA